MHKTKLYIILFLLGSQFIAKAQFETFKDSVVQFYGVVMSADSLRAIPAVSIVVKGQNRGTVSNETGVFSIVVLKGDIIDFSCIGYKPKAVKIPFDLKENQYSIIQLLVTDTVFLPATIIKHRISREQFERDFINTKIPDDAIAIARNNNSIATRRYLMATIPVDGKEASAQYLRQSTGKLYYSGQIMPQNIFNPMAWSEFIKAWKRGDFRKKK